MACLIKNNTLASEIKKNKAKILFLKNSIFRIDVLREVLKNLKTNTKLISTTGYTSRELYQLRKQQNFKKEKIFI